MPGFRYPKGGVLPSAVVAVAVLFCAVPATASDETEVFEEGCLSVPGIRGDVIRSVAVEVTYLDEKGLECRLQADGLLARIIQHEIDHLEGVLFIDRLSIAKKMLIKSKLRSLIDGSGSKE